MVAHAQLELEAVGQELLSQARQRQEEHDRLSNKVQELRQELTRVIEESRANADSQAQECQAKVRSALESRKRTEEQYIQLQVRHMETRSKITPI